jgi:trimethylamine:corrinoid methyltransferase-like protein
MYQDQDLFTKEGENFEAKWQFLAARCSPEEKQDIQRFCKGQLKLPYSVVTRIIWRRIISKYREMPQVRKDEMSEIEKNVDEVLEYIPVIRRQQKFAPKLF